MDDSDIIVSLHLVIPFISMAKTGQIQHVFVLFHIIFKTGFLKSFCQLNIFKICGRFWNSIFLCLSKSGWQDDWKKIRPNFWKSSPNSCQSKFFDNMFIKSSILKSLTSTLLPSELYKYLQQTIFSPKNFLILLKSSPNMAKFRPIWSPGPNLKLRIKKMKKREV